MKKSLLLAFILVCCNLYSQDKMLSEDKLLHFSVSTAMSFSGHYLMTRQDLIGRAPRQVLVISGSFIAGCIKEKRDGRSGGSGVSAKDLLADAAGILAGTAIFLILKPEEKTF